MGTDTAGFLSGGGELGARMREMDWTGTPLGPPQDWPQSLKTAVRIMLTSRQPIWIGWGSDLIYLYNDPYKSIIGGKHPWAIGRPTREVWKEIWGDIGPMLATAMKGDEGTYVEEQLLIMERNGYPEETYYTFSYSPIPADDGGAGGIICANTEDTGRVIGERQITLLKDVAARTVDARTPLDACRLSAEAIATNARDLPFAALYLKTPGGYRRASLAGIAGEHPAFPLDLEGDGPLWPLDAAMDDDEDLLVDAIDPALDLPGGDWSTTITRAAVFPIVSAGETGTEAVLVAGVNPYRLYDEEYRGFLRLLAQQIGSSIANAEAYEAERRRAEALAEIDKAKTAFFSNVSHEFRTPLTLMLGPLEDTLASSSELPDRHRERIELAHRNSLRLLRLVNSLLDFSRIEAGRIRACFRPVDLGQLTEDLASSFRAATEKAGLDLVIEVEPLGGEVYVDRDMWEKIILNLVSNAFKFTFEGSITVRVSDTGSGARLTVTDTGIGIPESELPHLFDRFHRVEGAKGRSYEGSGIGLALVKELVEQLGGRIGVSSEEGQGTQFTIDLPYGSAHLPKERLGGGNETPDSPSRADAFVEEALRWLPDRDGADEEVVRDLEPVEANEPQESIRHTVLLADDNADLRDYISRLLTAHGYEVEAVGDGEAALRAIRRERPDIVISDVMMPRKDGFALLKEIRCDAQLRDLAVILLSARSGEEARVEGLEAGADDYLTKPFSARELVARVDSHLSIARLRRQALAALRENERRFRALVNASSEIVFRMSADWKVLQPLDGRGFVADLSEPSSDWLDEFVFDDDRDLVLAEVARAIETKTPYELESRVRRADGSTGWTHSRAIPILDDRGEVVEWFGMAADITERKRVEAALRESEARFRNMADNSPLMMWVTDAEAHCTYLNRSWYEFTGQSEEEALGFGWLDAVHPDDREWSGDTFRRANERRESFRLEYRLRHVDGTYRWAIDAASPRFDLDGEFLGYIGSVFDIDDRKRQENLRQLQNDLLELAIKERPLEEILDELVRAVEEHSSSGMMGSILLLDEERRRLRHGAAPSLPDAYNAAIDGIEIGPEVGSCGTAAYRGEAVFVTDIATDPLWKDFRDLAAEHGLASCWSTPIMGANGSVTGTFALYYDAPREPSETDLDLIDFITHTASLVISRKQTQEQLRGETRLLETLNRTGALVSAELDLERVVQHVTDAGVELTGAAFGAFFYNVEDASGDSLMLYTLSGVERAAFEKFPMPRNTKIFAPTFRGEGVIRAEDITQHSDYGQNAPHSGMPEGHLPVRSYLAVPVVSRSGEVVGALLFGHPEPGRFKERHETLMRGIAGQAAIAIDNARLYQAAQREIAQRKSAEAALQELNEDLETRVAAEIEERRATEAALHRAQRMESIGQLTGGIAHDFNNLLQVISGNLQLLSRDVSGDERAETRVKNALTGVSRGAKLASQLLAFGRRQPLQPKVINVGSLVGGMEEMLQRALGEEILIETRLPKDLWNSFADPVQVENSVLNLAINARDAMGGSGRIVIAAENVEIDERPQGSADLAPGAYVRLSVHDTGSGIAPDIIEKVFEPFFTTKPEGKGTGLGLSMVYGFVKQSGGDVTIDSTPGEGTMIALYLPRVHEDEPAMNEPGQAAPARGDERVLVVEDDEQVRRTACEMLEDLGYSVTAAANGDEAWDCLKEGGEYDLLFTDVVMPGQIRSPELARRARERHPSIAVLFTSGYAQDVIVHEGRLDEGVMLLTKPYTRETLAEKVRQSLERRSRQQTSAAKSELA